MPNISVKYTELQLSEICNKVGIVASEPDLQESYEITQDEADAINAIFQQAKPGVVEFDLKFSELIIGELHDARLIWANRNENLPTAEDLSMVSSLSSAIRKTEAAVSKISSLGDGVK